MIFLDESASLNLSQERLRGNQARVAYVRSWPIGAIHERLISAKTTIAIKPPGKNHPPAIFVSADSRIDISINLDILGRMELLEIFKALSNPTRLEILKGLKDPAKNFPPQDEGDVLTVGVCVSSIQEGIGLSQSTVSGYLATLQRVGLVEVRRIGQWTYYKRNEATISALAEIIGKDL